MILEEIVSQRKEDLRRIKKERPLGLIERLIGLQEEPRDFKSSLKRPKVISLIAEIKKASPSAGVIRHDLDPERIAQIYESSGASAISVLTEPHFFCGDVKGIPAVRDKVSLPVLRKDFIIDPYQIYEARAFGADAILLIVSILSSTMLRDFIQVCGQLGMEALVEVHTRKELEEALCAGASIIGINNRDLNTFKTDLSTTLHLMKWIPEEVVCVSESGIKEASDIRVLRMAGVDAVLIGTALMRAPNIRKKIEELFDCS
nr:indole-3-glycerol phosphate synthase TrpC [Desulfobacterales bacterium]